MMVQFFVPGAPVGKGRPRIGRVGAHARMFTPEKTTNYEAFVAQAARAGMAGNALLLMPVQVSMVFTMPIPASWPKKRQAQALAGEVWPATKPDIDNIEKAVFDAMNGVVWRDDVQVVRVDKEKRYGQTPGVWVVVQGVGNAAG